MANIHVSWLDPQKVRKMIVVGSKKMVVYDDIGGGVGDVIGYEEGAEAAQPFEVSPPIDAINCALVDEMFYHPWKG